MAVTMLDRIVARGGNVKCRPNGSVAIVGVSKLPAVLVDEIRANGEELKRCAGLRWCNRCEAVKAHRTTPAYWNEGIRYCAECCESMCAEFDRSRSWPTPPWTLEDLRAIGEVAP